jgi:hypothetical protein
MTDMVQAVVRTCWIFSRLEALRVPPYNISNRGMKPTSVAPEMLLPCGTATLPQR